MLATDPAVTFLLVLAIGVVSGILFDRLRDRPGLPTILGINSQHR